MKRFSCLLVTLVALAAGMLACGGGSDDAEPTTLSRYFPDRLADVGLDRVSEVRTFVGDSLWEYINGGAELYHSIGFVKVSTADYKSDEAELVLDLYQFESSDGAYGLYAVLRPDEPDIVPLGVEGYFTGSSLEFVKGDIMVRLVGYDASEATGRAIKALATNLAGSLSGTVEPPETFQLFPQDNAIAGTDKIIGEAFLGQAFLNMVYTLDYQMADDTFTLFLSDDPSGEAFAQWMQQVGDGWSSPEANNPGYDEKYYLLTPNSYYGDILAGLKNGKLVGVVNFSEQHQEFVADWLTSISASTDY